MDSSVSSVDLQAGDAYSYVNWNGLGVCDWVLVLMVV